MSKASEHYQALADESAVSAAAWRTIQDDALSESTAYFAHSVGGRVLARVAMDASRLAREWDQRVQKWQGAAAEMAAIERQDPDAAMQADIGDDEHTEASPCGS